MPTESYRRIQRLLDEGMSTPKPKTKLQYFGSKEPSFSELSGFEKALDVLSRPLYATASAADAMLKGKNPFLEGIKGFAGHRRTTYSDVLGSAGMRPGVARTAMGFAADVLLDPTTYLGVGAVGKAGTITVKGASRALTAAGQAAREAAVTAKTVQGARVLAHPRMTTARLEALQKRLPADVGTFLRGAPPEALKGPTGASALGTKYGRDAVSRLLGEETRMGANAAKRAVTPGLEASLKIPKGAALEAPSAVKFMGMPIVRTGTLGKAVKPVLGGVERGLKALPLVGKAVDPVKDFAKKTGGFIKSKFSDKTGNAEYDFIRSRARDVRHLMDVETGEFWKDLYARVSKKVGNDPAKRRKLNEEWVKAIEGIEQDIVKVEPTMRAEAIRKRIDEFASAVADLSRKLGPMDYRVGKAQAAVAAAAKAADEGAIRDKVLAGMEGQEKKLKTEAVKSALDEAEQALRIAETPGGGDALSMLDLEGIKIRLSDEWLAKTGSTRGAELRDAIPSKYLGGPGKGTHGIDEVADMFGMTSDEVMDHLAKAGKKRKDYRETIKSLKGTRKEIKAAGAEVKPVKPPEPPVVEGQPIKIPGEALPESPVKGVSDIEVPDEHLAAVKERHFADEVEAEKAAAYKKVHDLKRALKMEEDDAARVALKSQLAAAETQLKHAEAKAAELVKRGQHERKVLYRERVDHVPDDPEIAELAKLFRERMERIYAGESRVNPLLGRRQRYMPHVMREEVANSLIRVVQQRDLHKIVKSGDLSTFTKNALQRSNDKGVLDVKIEDLIATGDIDVGRLRAELKAKGVELDSFDELLFESDPVKAGMGRELAHNRAVTAGQFVDDVLASPSFTKAVVDVTSLLKLRSARGASRAALVAQGADPEVVRVAGLLDQYEGTHSLFVPSPDYVRQFKTAGEQLEMKQGTHKEAVDLLKRLLDVDVEEYASKAAAGELPPGAKAYLIPNEIADHLNKAHRLMSDDKRVAEFLQVFDKWQGWWKAVSTVIRPAFHVRNAISNLWQNFLAGVTNPAHYSQAAGILAAKDLSKLKGVGAYTAAEVKRLAEEFGVLKHGFIGSEIGEFLERSVHPSKNIFSTSGPLVRAGQKAGTSIEDNARLANFIDGLSRNMDPASAAQRVKKYLFDYADLSDTEKLVFRRLMPFYTFTRKSIPLALETLVTQPGKVAVLGKARAEAERHFQSLDHEYVADYVNDAFGIPVHKNAKGEFEYFLLKGYIPTVDIAKLDHKEMLGMLSPFVKAPIEQMLNTDFYRMKPISRFPTEMVQFMGLPMPARAAHLMRNIVVMAQIDREVFREGSTLGKGIASELSVRLQTQNPVDQMRRYVLATQMEMGELKRLKEQAEKAGESYKANVYDQRLQLLMARRDQAKERTLKLDPDAFKFMKPGQKAKTETPDFNTLRERMRREASVEAILKKQRKAQ